MFNSRTLAAIAALLVLSGCASSLSGSAYERRQARTAHEVQYGVVEEVREVQIEGTKSGVGPMAGAAVGGIAAGSEGKGGAIAGVLGAVAGGIAGAAIEEGATRQKGLEITVKLDSGRFLAITQAADEEFKKGERVRVLFGARGDTRVTH
jgi:outer membrane lipoprotein SlyB